MTSAVRRRSQLAPSGRLRAGAPASLSFASIRAGLELMLLSRRLDVRAIAMQRLGRWGVHSPAEGQEAAVVGSCLAVDPARDWLVPQYRELAACLHHGHPLERLVAAQMGRPAAGRIPEGVRLLPVQVALAAQLPQAVGLAWGLRLQATDAVVLTYLGDGASSEGDFHEACNLAGVMRAPVVFLLQNNGWAISTPRRLQSAAPTLAIRALGYGFPGVVVDGNDLLAVHQATLEAVARARRGDGPTLIEAQTYRLGFHNTTDDPGAYVDPDELGAARRLDPILRVRRYLTAHGEWDEEREQAACRAIDARLDAAIAAAERLPLPGPAACFDHVYAEPPPRVEGQRARALAQGAG